MTVSSVLMDPTVYENPHTFLPCRWLGSPTEMSHLERFFVPFGRGTRMCIGMK